MKTRAELEHAHTLLVAALELNLFKRPSDLDSGRTALNVICWALGHDHDSVFSRVLAILDKELVIEIVDERSVVGAAAGQGTVQ